MATALSAFSKYIRPHIPMCPDVIMDDALLRAAISFCTEAEVLSELLVFSTVAGNPAYTLSTAAGTRPARVRSIRLDNTPLAKADEASVRASGRDVDTAQPRFYYTDGDTGLTLLPTPDAVYDLRADVTVRPSRSATTVDDRLFELWQDGVVSGALMRLYAMPSQPWFNPELAQSAKLVYQREVDDARWKMRQGFVGRPVSVGMRPFGGRTA